MLRSKMNTQTHKNHNLAIGGNKKMAASLLPLLSLFIKYVFFQTKNDVPSANNSLLCEARRWSYNVEGHGSTSKSYTSNWTLALLQKYTRILWSLRKEATLLSTCLLDASIQHHCTKAKAERALKARKLPTKSKHNQREVHSVFACWFFFSKLRAFLVTSAMNCLSYALFCECIL